MRNHTELTDAGRQYAAAYDAHYGGRDLPVALQLYMNGRGIAPGHTGGRLLRYTGPKYRQRRSAKAGTPGCRNGVGTCPP